VSQQSPAAVGDATFGGADTAAAVERGALGSDLPCLWHDGPHPIFRLVPSRGALPVTFI
jgi:hypothetical protein